MKEMHRLHNSFYSNAGFHHIGVACKDIKTTLNELLIFLPKDIECSDLIHDAKLDATLQLIKLNAQTYLELVSGNVVEGILRKRLYLYHTCFEVSDIKRFSEDIKSQGCVAISPLTPADLFDGRLVQFFQTPLGITEILER